MEEGLHYVLIKYPIAHFDQKSQSQSVTVALETAKQKCGTIVKCFHKTNGT